MFEYAKDRPIIFSTFQPDAAQLVRKLQSTYPVSTLYNPLFIAPFLGIFNTEILKRNQVLFLTNGGSEIYHDVRRNSLEEAVKHCLENGLQGIVSEVKAVFRNPAAVTKIKEAKLSLLTYGQLK